MITVSWIRSTLAATLAFSRDHLKVAGSPPAGVPGAGVWISTR